MKKTSIQKSPITGVGLYAAEPIRRGEKILTIEGDVILVRDFLKLPAKIKKESDNWIGISRYRYINTKRSPMRFINHSCDPNAAIVSPRTFIAIKDIALNEEITMDYSLTEAGQDYSIQCTCKSKKCRGIIEPINKLPVRIFKSYLPYVSKNFQRTYWAMTK